jgi:hypothetical protein
MKKTIIIIKSTDISLDRQALSASVIWFEKLSREHQLSWRKLLKIIYINNIKYKVSQRMNLRDVGSETSVNDTVQTNKNDK